MAVGSGRNPRSDILRGTAGKTKNPPGRVTYLTAPARLADGLGQCPCLTSEAFTPTSGSPVSLRSEFGVAYSVVEKL